MRPNEGLEQEGMGKEIKCCPDGAGWVFPRVDTPLIKNAADTQNAQSGSSQSLQKTKTFCLITLF